MIYIKIILLALIIFEGIWVNARSCYIMATDKETMMGVAINIFIKNFFALCVKLYTVFALHKFIEYLTINYGIIWS